MPHLLNKTHTLLQALHFITTCLCSAFTFSPCQVLFYLFRFSHPKVFAVSLPSLWMEDTHPQGLLSCSVCGFCLGTCPFSFHHPEGFISLHPWWSPAPELITPKLLPFLLSHRNTSAIAISLSQISQPPAGLTAWHVPDSRAAQVPLPPASGPPVPKAPRSSCPGKRVPQLLEPIL